MNKLITKARSGVTLVELLVVILIVTILSVSMLPLLQPFVTEAQYAAEAIPVIANIRTKIGIYQYDKGQLPSDWSVETVGANAHTWVRDTSDPERFLPSSYPIAGYADTGSRASVVTAGWNSTDTKYPYHLGMLIDVNYEDLKGKRSEPVHYQYYVISATNNFSYALGCFGDGDGLKSGTGYAVCELNFTKQGKKYIGTWKRYKPTDDANGAIQFNKTSGQIDAAGRPVDCYVPEASAFDTVAKAGPEDEATIEGLISNMKAAGWEF